MEDTKVKVECIKNLGAQVVGDKSHMYKTTLKTLGDYFKEIVSKDVDKKPKANIKPKKEDKKK